MEKTCTIFVQYDSPERASAAEIRKQLQEGDVYEKRDALKKAILLISNGELLPNVLMTVIQYVMPSKDHELKKLMILYWEVIPKKAPDGKLLPEMILVCNSLRNDLNHPNEFIRGATLRFLCKLKEAELLEPLVPSVRANLEHRHSYVRRNAVMAIYYIYKSFDFLIPDAPELVFDYLKSETDASCKRNAFIMLYHCAEEKAVEYLAEVLDQVSSFGDILQLIVVELIRKVCRHAPGERGKFVRCIHKLLDSDSAAVRFESAGALLALSSAPTAIRAASSTFIALLSSQSDNNVKMIVLDKLEQIKKRNAKVLRELLMDIMRALASPNMDIRRKVLDIALDLVSPRNIDEVVQVLKKEIAKTQGVENSEKSDAYRQLLIQSTHQCAVRFPEVANSVIHVLMDFVGDENATSAMDVIIFIREVIETYDDLRSSLLEKLVEVLPQIKFEVVYRATLWVLAEYSRLPEQVDRAITAILAAIGKLPLGKSQEAEEVETADENTSDADNSLPNAAGGVASRSPLILADGTYATQSALVPTTSASTSTRSNESVALLRKLLENGESFLASAVASALTKLVLKTRGFDISAAVRNALTADILLQMVGFIRCGEEKHSMWQDNKERILVCINVLTRDEPLWMDLFTVQGRVAFSELLTEQRLAKEADDAKQVKKAIVQADSLICLRQLKPQRAGFANESEDEGEEADLERAAGYGADDEEAAPSRKRHIHQMTGYSDLIYAEAFVHVHQYDIVLDVMILNQTADTLQNLTLELATLGDLKLCERPQSYTVGPHGTVNIKANIKVSSTETGVIFGNLVYDVAGSGASESNVVILNDIHIDIMDYILPATCTSAQFRSMWQEFEWENKVVVNTTISDPKQYLEHILKSTNMKCLTPASALAGDSAFLAANLYAKSTFGEDALVNLGIERRDDGKIVGHIRIRAKTQGIALSLGDKITLEQRSME
mmetsp:Transcript_24653/g.61827  ORF Transcript_24653/g.61827 Transcript_24653/m.61827 type:complete len:954 (+) Transcript_24653:242-3103(+)|eukprot:CAMPEP_0177640284 /NCGR_PEP_ID=MMETSP0447-20121125/6463_1 /TAXON_ID=0 /ORGANISM="Stygamoeba regulata, Strain BSH-02190019" /LENGTH=953 /DNA_ID=CAMNT_0019142349 /DNA_START=171 /DNA_END=3032 /DNA_ORIENTATION=+